MTYGFVWIVLEALRIDKEGEVGLWVSSETVSSKSVYR